MANLHSKSAKPFFPSSLPMPSPVRVVLRVRPFLPSEVAAPSTIPCVALLNPDRADEEVTIQLKDQWSSRSECYKLDSFFGQEDRVRNIFALEVFNIIPGVFQGLNATIFAYGATGSGKTYTMQGADGEPGMIPLAMSAILSSCNPTDVCSVEMAYYEIYMDRCYDLLDPNAKEIVPMDDKDARVQLKGLSWAPIHSMDEFHVVFDSGIQRRKVARTGLNDVSSRSHAILTIAVTNGVVNGKLNLIDLAGNEDNRRTCNDGIRLKESAKINQSLFALSNVIYALNNNEPRIPYRESKLTRILQDSLGGTSRSLMIACLNPISYQEAVHTVSLAARSRKVVNHPGLTSNKETPKVKVDMEAKLRAWLDSKGKTKTYPRILGPFSPHMVKSPSSINHLKSPGSICSSAKNCLKTRGRKLFDSVALTSDRLQKSNSTANNKLLLRENVQEQNDTRQDKSLSNFKEERYEDRMNTLNSRNQLNSIQAWPLQKEIHGCGRTAITKAMPIYENIRSHNDSPTCVAGSPLNKENLAFMGSLAANMTKEVHHSIGQVRSPLSPNMTLDNKMSSGDCLPLSLLQPKTPKSNCIMDDGLNITPLDMFKTSSSNLKDTLVQEYLAFLNVASKEELMQLKGIGQKRAEYILELREQTPKPLKSLSDLEKIGLSSKQVYDMFRRAASGIFA